VPGRQLHALLAVAAWESRQGLEQESLLFDPVQAAASLQWFLYARHRQGEAMSEPLHDEALVNLYVERISALSVSAFDGADVSSELDAVMREAVTGCQATGGPQGQGTLTVLATRLRERADAAEREDQPLVRDTFRRAAERARA
jgi:hypothetical protein